MPELSTGVICWTDSGIALFKRVAIPELVSLTTTTPSILASSWSSWDWVKVSEFPSKILKVNPEGKLVSAVE